MLVLRGETSTSAYISIYVIVTLLDDGRHKWPKYVVEDK